MDESHEIYHVVGRSYPFVAYKWMSVYKDDLVSYFHGLFRWLLWRRLRHVEVECRLMKYFFGDFLISIFEIFPKFFSFLDIVPPRMSWTNHLDDIMRRVIDAFWDHRIMSNIVKRKSFPVYQNPYLKFLNRLHNFLLLCLFLGGMEWYYCWFISISL